MSDLSNFDMMPVQIVKSNTDGYSLDEAHSYFSSSTAFPKNTKMALQNLSLYYSWYNISATLGNNTLSYTHNSITYTITFPDGSYSIEDITGFIHFTMKQNNHYLLDAVGDELYFIKFEENIVYNCFTLTCDVVPSVLGTYTNPGSMVLTGTTMTITIPATPIRDNLGFSSQTFPTSPQATQQQKNSEVIPQITPTTSVQIHSPLVNNSFYSPKYSDVFYTFTPKSSFGTNLAIEPSNLVWNNVHSASFNEIFVRFTDQNNKALGIRDFNWQMTLILLIPRSK
jgi:hypothetical protein